MAPEPRNATVDMPKILWNNCTELPEGTNVTFVNRTDMTHTVIDPEYISHILILSVTVLIGLCGMVGNGTVIWLLGFRLERNPFGVYILNLAIADFTYLFNNVFEIGCVLSSYSHTPVFWFANALAESSYLMGLTLLMAISIERCVSVLWPLWYKCHRPAHLSTILCALIWGLSVTFSLVVFLCRHFGVTEKYSMWPFSNTVSCVAFLVLLVSGLTLVIRVQCSSWRRQPSKLYWTVLLNVLAFLLLSVPRGVYVVYSFSTDFNPTLWLLSILLSVVNSAVNPVIYFFVGQHGKQRGRKPLREVLQSALMDEETGTEERRGITDPRQNRTTPEHQGGGAPPSPQV